MLWFQVFGLLRKRRDVVLQHGNLPPDRLPGGPIPRLPELADVGHQGLPALTQPGQPRRPHRFLVPRLGQYGLGPA
jgi:hypothetical protein